MVNETILQEGGENASICLRIDGLGSGSLKTPISVQLEINETSSTDSSDYTISGLEVVFPEASVTGSM